VVKQAVALGLADTKATVADMTIFRRQRSQITS
jgi:hypothetical protein